MQKKKVLIVESEDFIDAKRREIKELEFNKEEIQRDKQRTLSINAENFESEKKNIIQSIEKYTRMISAKPNSLKEFLNEEADGWESELYPFMDESLLDRSIDELEPSILNEERLLSLSIKTDTLKKILTKDEAALKIERHELELQNLKLSYEKSLLDIALRFKQKQEEIQEKILFLQSDRETKRESILKLEEEIVALTKTKEKALLDFNNVYAKKCREHQNNISAFNDEVKNSKGTIFEIEEGVSKAKHALRNAIKDLEEEFTELLGIEYETLQKWLESEEKRVDEFIKVQEEKKNSITQDERITELEDSLNVLEKLLLDIRESQLFLKDYKTSKPLIESLLVLENRLINSKLRFENFRVKMEEKIEELEYKIEELSESKKTLLKQDRLYKKGLDAFGVLEFDFSEVVSRESKKYLYELVESFNSIILEYKNRKIDLKSKLDRLNRLKNTHNDVDIYFNFDEYDNELYLSKSLNIVTKIDEVYVYKNKKLLITKESGNKKFRNFVNNSLPQNMSVFNDSEDKFLSQVAKINKNLSGIDFGVIKDIKLNPKVGDKKSIAKLLGDLNASVATLSSLLNESSLFYEQSDVLAELSKLEMKFKEIKKELKGSAISLDDTIDLTLSFKENEKQITEVSQLKNESSTGGSMLLKIAIAISILQLFTSKERTPFFLIVDEVSRLHSDNQEKLRAFANSKGFGIVFVTPEPTYSKPEFIKYYRFQKNSDNEFEAIELNV